MHRETPDTSPSTHDAIQGMLSMSQMGGGVTVPAVSPPGPLGWTSPGRTVKRTPGHTYTYDDDGIDSMSTCYKDDEFGKSFLANCLSYLCLCLPSSYPLDSVRSLSSLETVPFMYHSHSSAATHMVITIIIRFVNKPVSGLPINFHAMPFGFLEKHNRCRCRNVNE